MILVGLMCRVLLGLWLLVTVRVLGKFGFRGIWSATCGLMDAGYNWIELYWFG